MTVPVEVNMKGEKRNERKKAEATDLRIEMAIDSSCTCREKKERSEDVHQKEMCVSACGL